MFADTALRPCRALVRGRPAEWTMIRRRPPSARKDKGTSSPHLVRVQRGHCGIDHIKALLSHLITREFNSPTNSLRTPYVRVEPYLGVGACEVVLRRQPRAPRHHKPEALPPDRRVADQLRPRAALQRRAPCVASRRCGAQSEAGGGGHAGGGEVDPSGNRAQRQIAPQRHCCC
eukprot:6516440-Pyramimonas_sp.AAC.1